VIQIRDLITQRCPNGVEYKALGDLMDYEQPTKYLVSSTAYDGSYPTPVLTAGQTFILGFTNEKDGIYPASPDEPVLIFDDFTTTFKWVDFPFKAKSSAMKMLTPKPDMALDFRFVYFAMQSISYQPRDHARQWISTYSAFKIPVPPVEVQREVVRLLDSFVGLKAELESTLETEIEARQVQHDHYRRLVLGLTEPSYDGEKVALSKLVDFTNGKAHERFVVPDGSIVLLTARFISTTGKSARRVGPQDALTPARRGDIAMVMSDLPNGRALARCFYVEEDGKYTANQRVCLLRVRDQRRLSTRWLYHFLDRNPQLLAHDNGKDQTHLKKGQILDVYVPLIPLAEQERAAAILDRLDANVRELVLRLQDEQEARRKQYEYCHDRLLTFPEAA
jgi:type I restriction enzyme, S subunit